jgi:hypothetical protein
MVLPTDILRLYPVLMGKGISEENRALYILTLYPSILPDTQIYIQ